MRKLSYEFENYNGLQLIISAYPPIDYSQLNIFELNMLKENSFSSLLSCEVEVIDNEYKFHYPVHGLKKLDYHMQVNCTTQLDLYQMTVSVLDTVKSTYANMLMPDGCLLSKDAIFYEESSGKTYIAYLPLQHKDSIQSSLLQWFLHWIDHVLIVDYNHLFKLVSMLNAIDVTIEKLQETLLSYIYENQPTTVTSQPHSVNKMEINSVVMDEKQESSKEPPPVPVTSPREKVSLTAMSSLKDRVNEQSEEHAKPNILRLVLLIIIGLALIAAIWTQLYLPSRTTAYLLISIGLTVSTFAIGIIFLIRYIKKKETTNYVIEEATDEHYPPYHFLYNFSQDTATPDSIVEPLLVNKSIKQSLSNPTVKLDSQHATEFIGATIKALFLCRSLHNEKLEFPLTNEEFIIGRSSEGVQYNEVYSGVSRLHIQFQQLNGLVVMRDLGSRNGSYLNGQIIVPYKNYYVTELDHIQLVDKAGPVYSIRWN